MGRYKRVEPVWNVPEVRVEVEGKQELYVKPVELNTMRQVLRNRNRWAYVGVYPNNTVKSGFGTGNQVGSRSQGMYIHDKSVASMCVEDVNGKDKYVGHRVKCGPNDCALTSGGGYRMSVQQRNAPYTKRLYEPMEGSEYVKRIQRKCEKQEEGQPDVWRVHQTGTGILRGGTSVRRVGSTCFVEVEKNG